VIRKTENEKKKTRKDREHNEELNGYYMWGFTSEREWSTRYYLGHRHQSHQVDWL